MLAPQRPLVPRHHSPSSLSLSLSLSLHSPSTSTASSSAQEYKGELCLDGTPFCWVPLGKGVGDCAAACAGARGPQRAPTDAGDALAAAGGRGRAPHFVCRARGDGGEGAWRAGFNLKAGAGPPQCAVAAGGTEEAGTAFDCLCHAPPSAASGLGPGAARGLAAAVAAAWQVVLIAFASFLGSLAAGRMFGALAGRPGSGASGGGGGGGAMTTGLTFRPGASAARNRRASHTGLSSMLLPINGGGGHGHGSDEEGGGCGGGGEAGGAAAPLLTPAG